MLHKEPAEVNWHNEWVVNGYNVQTYEMIYPEMGFPFVGGVRQCFVYFQNVDGTVKEHSAHIAGRYCESGGDPIEEALAQSVLRKIVIRKNMIK